MGPVTTSLDVREQGGGLRNRTKVWSLENCDRSCFLSREVEKPSPEKGLLGQGGGFQLLSSLRQEGHPGPDINVRVLCAPLGGE